jgi:hypothetical protein
VACHACVAPVVSGRVAPAVNRRVTSRPTSTVRSGSGVQEVEALRHGRDHAERVKRAVMSYHRIVRTTPSMGLTRRCSVVYRSNRDRRIRMTRSRNRFRCRAGRRNNVAQPGCTRATCGRLRQRSSSGLAHTRPLSHTQSLSQRVNLQAISSNI